MRRLALVAALTALFAPAAVWAADSGLAPSADTLAAGASPEGSLRVSLAKNGNVRFAPTTNSKAIVTLPARSEVEILGAAKVAGWYVIRFPREGNAWVHSKVLQAVDGGKRWRVLEDKSRARDDSTLGGQIVAELYKGEILEDKGRINGDWRAVYLPNAVAYISASVLDMPADLGKAKLIAEGRANEAVQTWGTAQALYGSYFDQLKSNPQNALVLDWQGLAVQLDAVIRYHPDADTRVSAQRIKDGIVNVAAAADNLQRAKGITPVKRIADLPATSPTSSQTSSQSIAQKNPPATGVIGDPLAPPKLAVPGESPTPVSITPLPITGAPGAAEPVAPTEIATKPQAPAAPAKAFVVEGFVTQQNFENVGVSEVLVDGDSNIVAFLKVQVGKDIQLSEYYWRWVGVKGEVQHVDQSKHTLGRDVPLVIVDGLSLSGRWFSAAPPIMAKATSPLDTPMMRQYLEAKSAQPEALLLMRMGDFYEAFLADAEALSRHTGVTLTSRNKDDPQPIAMAGIPHHQLPVYLPKLLALGLRVAVMDQLEDPRDAAKDGRTLVKRGLTRLITPGTLLDEETLQPGEANRLVAVTGLVPDHAAVGIAALDVSTGRFTVEEATTAAQLAVALARLAPAEVVVPEDLRHQAAEVLRGLCAPVALPPISCLPAFAWKAADARRWLAGRLRVGSLDGFDLGLGCDHLVAAAAAALRYAEGAVRIAEESAALAADSARGLGHIRSVTRLRAGSGLVLDATCRRNLDLLRNSRDGARAGSLLAAVDRTRTAPGARLLAEWLARPLAEVTAIAARHDAVGCLVDDDQLRADVRDALARIYDLERLVARIATGRAHARDLVQLAQSLSAAADVGTACSGHRLPRLLATAATGLDPAPELIAMIRRTLVDEPPLTLNEGGLIRDGIDPELDDLRAIRTDASAWLAAYQSREAQACGLPKLKVGYNSIFGYYLELPKSAAEKAPAHFIRKQTLVNAERYITPELKEYEDKALGAEERIRAREQILFAAVRAQAEEKIAALQTAAEALATIDVCAGLAETARLGGWCRPLVDDSLVLEFSKARHPVVEEALGRGTFVANDCHLEAASATPEAPGTPCLALITGPNMAGKSTYIRQVAVLVILAQAGAFVPAHSARIGVVDRVFTRVGAGDELARGQSTFMVEMAETAAILHHATVRSLVILDEVGRGTSTFDGVSLAWAITEHLHDKLACRTLFATHYHELTEIAEERPGVANLTVAVAENADDVVFLHRIVPGAATKSYGIHVARIAGVPASVISRARAVLTVLERSPADEGPTRVGARPVTTPTQLSLFGYVTHPAIERLQTLDLDNLTPRQALTLLAELSEQAKISG